MDFYQRRSHEVRIASDEAVRIQGLYRWGFVVLGLFVCIILYESFAAKSLPPWTPVLAVPVGAYLLTQSRRQQYNALKLFRLCDYYDAGIARLTRKWDVLDEGKDFFDPVHFYATDLDLFGHGSLFQLVCSSRTQAGRETLAGWMKAPASREEVLARHDAVSELLARQDLREALAVAGAIKTTDCRPGTFRAWKAESPSTFPFWRRAFAFILPFSPLVLLVLYWLRHINMQSLWLDLTLVFLVQTIYAAPFYRRVRSVLEGVGPISTELPIVSEIFQIVDQEKFSTAKLVALAERMKQGSAPLRRLRRLIRLMQLLKQTHDPWSTVLSYALLWGTQFTMAIDQWHRRYGNRMLDWLAALGEFEALNSLAAYTFEHPLDPFPEVLEQGPLLDAEGLGHPLLDENICVRNDVRLGNDVRFLIVSGSNMSGKSTFVRAIGLNAVLTWMGGPVRCTKLRLSPLAIGAAVRVQDSLVDGQSHFLAEMQRLRRMIDVASAEPLLYLADEIMSGTNSHDRRIATEWVVRALVLRGAIGVITTHDLALTEIASNDLPGQNVYFEDSGEAGSLHFDYKLRCGLLTHSNALNIAHMLGIDTAAVGTASAKGK
jgi:hypothetical protein